MWNSLSCVRHGVVSWPCRLFLARFLCPWNPPGKNTGVGGHSLLQGIFPTQGLNLALLHCRQTLPSTMQPLGKPAKEHKIGQKKKPPSNLWLWKSYWGSLSEFTVLWCKVNPGYQKVSWTAVRWANLLFYKWLNSNSRIVPGNSKSPHNLSLTLTHI